MTPKPPLYSFSEKRPGLEPGQDGRLLQLLKWLVVLGAISYLAIGIYCYVNGSVSDLARRWREAGYWLQGYDPIQVARSGMPYLPEYGRLHPRDGYAPWAYVYALLTASPLLPFRVVKTLFFLFNMSAIAALGYFIWREYQSPRNKDQWLILFATALCCSALTVTLRWQQYGIIVTVLIWASLYFEEKRRPFLAGLSLAFAFIKPQTAALFFLLPLVRKSFRTCLWCLVILAVATGIAAWQCHTRPWVLTLEIFNSGVPNWSYLGIGDPLKYIIGYKPLLFASMALSVFLVYALLTRWKAAPTYHLAAVPAVFSTFWMSHRNHDLMIVSLLAVPIFSLALKEQQVKVITLMVLTAYCFPHFAVFYGEAYLWPVPLLFRLTWLLGFIYLLEPGAYSKLKN